jgi:hypothetical protein
MENIAISIRRDERFMDERFIEISCGLSGTTSAVLVRIETHAR